MDKRETLASYNRWKQKYKMEDQDMPSDQTSTGWSATSIRLSYSKKDGRPKVPSEISKSLLRTKRTIGERGASYLKGSSTGQKRLFKRRNEHEVERKEISILSTINEICDATTNNSVIAKEGERSTSESTSQLLNDTNIVQMRNKDTVKGDKRRKNEKIDLTHWGNVIYENISSEKFRVYFVYFAIFVTLASALAATISAVRGVLMEGKLE